MKPSYGPKLTSELKLMTQRLAVLEDAVRSLLAQKEGPTAGLPSSTKCPFCGHEVEFPNEGTPGKPVVP